MAFWLMKQEPEDYSYADLERDGTTTWDGVKNPLALKHLRACAAGDLAFYYHTGKEKAVVGVMEVVSVADGVPTVRAVRRLAKPVTLATIKADATFAKWELVKQARLSVMPVTKAMWDRVEKHADGKLKGPDTKA
jgi:predicted RNA-binding protein with PUA-like domain